MTRKAGITGKIREGREGKDDTDIRKILVFPEVLLSLSSLKSLNS